MSKGRNAPSGTGSASMGLSPLKQGSPVVSADDSNKPIKLVVKGSALPNAVPVPGQDDGAPIKRERELPLWPLAVPFAGGLIAYGLYRGSKHADAQETEQPPAGALLAAPGLVAGPAEVAGGVVRNVAKGMVAKTLGDIAVTGVVAAGILVAGGTAVIVTVNHGLNEMIAAQDKYNAAIDTRRDDHRRPGQPTSATQIKENPDYSDPQREREYRRAKDFCESEPPLSDNECSNLSKLIDHAEKCIDLYEVWDERWEPGRHAIKIAQRRNRVENLKDKHKRKCAQQ